MHAPQTRPALEVGVGAATAVLLLCGLALQLAVFAHGGHVALSDLPRVLLHRHIAPTAPPYFAQPLEYPVLSGLLLWAADLVWPTALGVLLTTALAAGACCMLVAVRMARRFGPRAWRWALALPVLLYAFQNWDIFAITALALALLAFEQGHDRTAGVALGLGAGIKLFPLAVVPVLAAIRWREGRHRDARRLLVGGTGTFLAVNLPVALLAPHGWWWTYQFQSQRQATWGTAWFYVLRASSLPVHGPAGAQLANVVSCGALLAGLGWLTWRVLRHEIGPFAAAGAAVAIFILANKVYSPTYDVWLVVFFVMVPFSPRLWVSFCAVDLAVFVTVYGYFHGVESAAVVHTALPVLVVIRTAVLVAVIVRATREPVPPSAPRPVSVPKPHVGAPTP